MMDNGLMEMKRTQLFLVISNTEPSPNAEKGRLGYHDSLNVSVHFIQSKEVYL